MIFFFMMKEKLQYANMQSCININRNFLFQCNVLINLWFDTHNSQKI